MKHFPLVLLAAMYLTGCSDRSQRAANSNNEIETNSSEAASISKNQADGLTTEQTQRLDKRIPSKIREILDKAEQITISYDVDKETMQLEVLVPETVPNVNVKVSDPLKREFLDSFYSDAASNSNGSLCFSPRHRVNAKYKTETVELDICYECDRFQGESSSGNFGGGLDGQRKSSAVLDAIIKKYGTKIK